MLVSDSMVNYRYSQNFVQQTPLGHEKGGCYAEGCLKKISGKRDSG